MNISDKGSEQSSWTLVIVILTIVLTIFLLWKFVFSQTNQDQLIEEPVVQTLPEEPIIENSPLTEIEPESFSKDLPVEEQVIIEELALVEPVTILEKKPAIPLNESDTWVQKKLMEIIWRKELLDIFINEDMIRRFVVFIDNFAQGNLSYSNSPVTRPVGKFKVLNEEPNGLPMFIDKSSFERFSQYVELLRAIDTDILVQQYHELTPLINEAYEELGYPDSQFKEKLATAMTKVLDIEFPKENSTLIRPSVMYKYESETMESLDDADKLMLRMGKENLLVIKSVLLEINEKLGK